MFKKILISIFIFLFTVTPTLAAPAQLKDYIDPLNMSDKSNSNSASGLTNTVSFTVGTVLDQVFGILGIFALALIIYSGIKYIISFGNKDKAKKARDFMIWAAIGLVVIFLSYAVVKFVLEKIVTIGKQL